MLSKIFLRVLVVIGICSSTLASTPRSVCPKVTKYKDHTECKEVSDLCNSDNDCRKIAGQKCCPTEGKCFLSCQKTVKQETCSEPIDLALVLDSSGSISKRNWKKVKNFAKRLIDHYDISDKGTHVAIVTYSTRAKINIKFNTYTGAQLNSVNIKRDIDTLEHSRGHTFIDKALYKANHGIFTRKAGMRDNVKKVCIVFTDGKQTTHRGRYTPLVLASRPLKLKKVEMYSLGVGLRVDKTNLKEMASLPIDSHVFTASSFNQLAEKASELAQSQCTVPCNKPVDLAVLLDSSGSISDTNWEKVKNFTKTLVDIFGVSKKGSHIAVVTYSTSAKVDLTFGEGNDLTAADVKRAVDQLIHQKGYTYINKALDLANRKVFTRKAGMRTDARQLCIVLTDGLQTRQRKKVSKIIRPKIDLHLSSRPIKEKGVVIYTLGVGSDVEVMELIHTASSPSNVYNAINFDHLSKKAKEISKAYCKVNSVP